MKIDLLSRWIAVALFAALWMAGCQATQGKVPQKEISSRAVPKLAPHPDSIAYPQFDYTPPNPLDHRVELPRGAVAYLVPSQELPLISLRMTFREKGWEPESSMVASFTLLDGLMRRGGTQELSPAAVEDSLEQHSVRIGVSVGDHSATLTMDALDSDFERYLPLLQSIALEPRIDSTELVLTQARMLQSIAHRYDRPAPISRDLYSAALYGVRDPALWRAESSEVTGVTRLSLLELAKNRFRPEKLVLGVSGKFNREEMISLLSKWLEQWPVHLEAEPDSLTQTPKKRPAFHLLNFQSEQAQIRMGQPFLRRPHPDYYATSIASYILGSGGFTSRLTAAVRSREGLAYSVWSFAESDYFSVGTAGVSLQTKAENTGYAIALIFEEIERLTREGPTAEELERAVEGLIASIPSLFDSPENTAQALMVNEFYGRSLFHYAEYPQRLREVTIADIQRVLSLYFAPEQMAITVVGPIEVVKQSIQSSDRLKTIPQIEWKIDHLRRRVEP